ncbi:putative quinol monooxygenase [Enterococcus faecium]|uniref:putative quinol monooxygenase n=1 Tax=Enterococcus faecium TaxID=1352 RepID=UPI000A357C8C|nr:antibiotic biosynthesis monooxygenase [Enterococcus faecium]OTN91538.1 hypothetical protein A5809_000903 [Enterococcus faecium]
MLMRLFELVTFENKLELFEQVGHENLVQSLEKEPGTWCMIVAHDLANPLLKYVFEVYKDESAYETHISSSHFQAFATFAKEGFSSRKVLALHPEITYEKETIKKDIFANEAIFHLVRVTVNPKNSEDFRLIVSEEMACSIEKEEGVLALISGCDQNHPSHWYFFEVYKNEEAYNSHKLTPHFKNYIERTKKMVEDKVFYGVKMDAMISQGKLNGGVVHD